jgi:hypothetical protein
MERAIRTDAKWAAREIERNGMKLLSHLMHLKDPQLRAVLHPPNHQRNAGGLGILADGVERSRASPCTGACPCDACGVHRGQTPPHVEILRSSVPAVSIRRR